MDVGVVEVRGREDSRFTRKQFEVDFIANLGSKRYYIQSAFAMSGEEKTEQEIQSLKRIDDSFKKIIIVKVFCGRETFFFFSTSVWTAAFSAGLGTRWKQGYCPSRRSVGYSRAWKLSSRRQSESQSREYCIK